MTEPRKKGCFNPELDKIKRIDVSWSDMNPESGYSEYESFVCTPGRPMLGKRLLRSINRLVCGNCGCSKFEVLSVPGRYETMARCVACG